MKKVLIINQGNTENYGDIAINNVLTNYFSKKYEVDFIPYWDEKNIFGIFYTKYKVIYKILMKFTITRDFVYKNYLKRKIQKKYDYVIIGGGELLSGHRGFNTAIYNISSFFYKKSKLYVIGVSGNGNLPELYRKRYKIALSKCKNVYVRDNFTKQVLENEYKIKCNVYPDVVFSYKKINDIKVKEKKKSDTLLFSPICYYDEIGKYLNLKGENEFIVYLVKKVINNSKEYKKLIIAPTVNDDINICKKLYDKLIEVNCFDSIELYDYKSLDFYLKKLNEVKKVISCRMHGMILAKIFNCEIETIVFKNKLLIFKNEYEQSNKNIKNIENESYESLERLLGD